MAGSPRTAYAPRNDYDYDRGKFDWMLQLIYLHVMQDILLSTSTAMAAVIDLAMVLVAAMVHWIH